MQMADRRFRLCSYRDALAAWGIDVIPLAASPLNFNSPRFLINSLSISRSLHSFTRVYNFENLQNREIAKLRVTWKNV